jgi:poly(3-hydroxybutyrate) depolymerase
LSQNQLRGSGEAGLVAGITQQVMADETRWTIDPTRVFVAGLSAGGALATILGATYPDLYAALGIHSGMEYRAATDVASARPAMQNGGPDPVASAPDIVKAMGPRGRLMPTIVFHGSADQFVRPVNGDQVVQQWMSANGLLAPGGYQAVFTEPSHTRKDQVPLGFAYTVLSWNGNDGRAVQEYWRVDGLDHAWSGGSPFGAYSDPRGPNATEALWAFFTDHPMP